MGLGTKTECDLSAGIAKIDFDILTAQMEKRFYSLVDKVTAQTVSIKSDSLTEESRKEVLLSMVSHGSRTLLQTAQEIAEVSELLHTLYNSKDREIEIVNKK